MFVSNLIKTHKSSKDEKRGLLDLFTSKRGKPQTRKGERIVIKQNMVYLVTDQGFVTEEVDIDKADGILMDDPYNVGYGNIPNHYGMVNQKSKKNILFLEKDGNTQDFEFTIESTDAMCELRKLVLHWKSKGHAVLDSNLNIDIK